MKPEIHMPKNDTGRDTLGIRYQGPVLSGLAGVNQQLERQALSSPQTSAQIREMKPGGVTYVNPASPFFSCQGLPVEPDPVYARQRKQLGHPSLSDPVLRFHMNLPPLPDPYEERRKQAEHYRKLKAEGKVIVY